MATGYSPKIVTDGLVLALDGANIRSFRGEPATNILAGIYYSQGTVNNTYFKSNYGSETVNIPAIGKRTSHFCNIYNDYNGGSGACCPNLFGFGDISVSPSTAYTYQIIFKTNNGYAHGNYMYQYQYNSGTYITEYGLFNNSRTEDLGDGWRHAWGTFTTTASTNRLITYLFHYEYARWNKVEVAGIMLSQRSTPIDAKYILNVNTTRGTTVATGGGWADLSGNNSHGELVNGPTYNSGNGGSLVFDGVNDYVVMSSPGNYPNYTFMFYCKWISNTQNSNRVFGLSNTGTYTVFNQSNIGFHYNPAGGSPPSVVLSSGVNIGFGNWCHIAVTVSSSSPLVTIYVNGVARNSTSTLPNINFSGNVYLGAQNTISTVSSNSQISKFNLYNRVLSAAEVAQNFNATRNRFGI